MLGIIQLSNVDLAHIETSAQEQAQKIIHINYEKINKIFIKKILVTK